jgi:DNA-binding transcriptional regulator LsrR (DeoR family)
MAKPDHTASSESATVTARFSPQLMHAAASLYYMQEATQAEVADRLGTSRPTVSRLLAEARRLGIVRFEVIDPRETADSTLADRTAQALNIDAVHLSPFMMNAPIGAVLAPALSTALKGVGLVAGDVMLVSSGRTVYEAAQAELPQLPGVLVVPTTGGQDEPEPWYQTSEIIRQVAHRVSGTPVFLYAPALPGPDMYDMLIKEPSIRRVLELWGDARCAVLGVGAPLLLRQSIPRFVPTDAISLRAAVGDICSRFYDRDGVPVTFPGLERLVATPLEVIKRIPVRVAVAAGHTKVPSIVAGARGAYFNQLVTDVPTAAAILASVADEVDALADTHRGTE